MGFWPHVELDALNGRGGLAGLRSAWRRHSETPPLSPDLNPNHKASLILALGPPLPHTLYLVFFDDPVLLGGERRFPGHSDTAVAFTPQGHCHSLRGATGG